MTHLTQKHQEWRRKVVKKVNPRADWRARQITIRHGKHGQGEPYTAALLHPPDCPIEHLLIGDAVLPEEVAKSVGDRRECAGGRWVTVHPHGDDEDGIPVYICPNHDGSYSIVGGAGGRLNGLRMDHVKSPEEYAHLGKERRAQRRLEAKVAEQQRQHQLGQEEYARQHVERQARQAELDSKTQEAQKAFVAAIAKAQGVDPSQFEVKPDHLRSEDPVVAERVAARTQEAALTWAKQVEQRTRDMVLCAYDDLAKDAVGDVASAAMAAGSFGDSGKGYQAHIEALAQARGLSAGDVQREQHNVSLQRFLQQNNYDLGAARAKLENVQSTIAKRKEHNAKVREASETLAKEHGAGPRAVEALPTTPHASNMEQAVEVLRAAQAYRDAVKQAEANERTLKGADDLRTLPKAAVMQGRESTPEEIDKAVADSLTQESQRRAMLSLVNTANDLEAAHGSLNAHLSVGHAAAFSAIGLAVDGATVDPLTADVLGPSGMARVLAQRWRQGMAPEEFQAVQQALGAQHVATQEKIANEGVAKADAFLKAAGELPEIEATDPESLQAALSVHAERTQLLRSAREAAGVARGRLEAAAAINEALLHKAIEPVQVSLGPIATQDALQQAYAIGLTQPSRYDAQGKMTDAGQFTIRSDGENRILQIHPAGLSALARQTGTGDVTRANRSAAIKSGREDDPDWLPEGITRRPATTFELDPLAVRSLDHALQLPPNASAAEIGRQLRLHIGARIQAGQDPFHVQSDIHSASFIAGLGLTPEAQQRYTNAVNEVAPYKLATQEERATEGARAEFRQTFAQHREAIRQKLESYADEFVDSERKAGRIPADEVSLDKQRIPLDAVAQDCVYQAALLDPRTSYAFTRPGDLDRQGRDAIRSYAFEHLFGIDPKSDEIITPLTDEERHGYEAWRDFSAKEGDPYKAIQEHWAQASAENTDLFGESEPEPLAQVDLGNPEEVYKVGRENAARLGYQPLTMPDGSKAFPFLEAGNTWEDNGAGVWAQTATTPRMQETIVSDLRGRIKGALRAHFLADMAGLPELAHSGWNPESVKTASDRWGEYCRDMGGEKRAIKTVQEYMTGDLVKRFAASYRQRTGAHLALAQRNVTHAENHVEAMLDPESRAAITSRKQARYSEVGKDKRGRYAPGERRGKVEQQEQVEREGAKLFGESETAKAVNTKRASLGRAAEGMLASMLPFINANRPIEAASNVSMAGPSINRQRAVRLILANKRQGLNLQAGSGKTVCAIGAFTHARAQGQASRALFVVPSNIVGQFGGELYKFVDPASGLRWHADPAARAEERKAAYAHQGTHICVVTPEALRQDVTEAVAEDLGVSPDAAVQRLSSMSEPERDAAISAAMHKRDWNFDFSLFDESHRLLGRAGKPDAHMARVADSVGRMTAYYIYSTADIVKNDASEAWDVLHKIAPERYHEGTRDAFLRRYDRDTLASGLALQREVEPFVYTAPVDTGVTHDRILHTGDDMALTPPQQREYDDVEKAYRQARVARQKKDTPGLAEALKVLNPKAFEGQEPQREAVKRLSRALGTLRETALNRVVNAHPQGVKAKWVLNHLDEHKGTPTLIFAHNLDTVKSLATQLKAKGHRVAVITGDMSADAKDRAKLAFSPPVGEAQADVLVSSDAGSVGANLQRGSILINVDSPMTSMTHEQRIAREVRQGQKNHVTVHDLVADVDYDRRARTRLERKAALRELMTTPAELIDDSGLAMRIEQARAAAYEKAYSQPEPQRKAA